STSQSFHAFSPAILRSAMASEAAVIMARKLKSTIFFRPSAVSQAIDLPLERDFIVGGNPFQHGDPITQRLHFFAHSYRVRTFRHLRPLVPTLDLRLQHHRDHDDEDDEGNHLEPVHSLLPNTGDDLRDLYSSSDLSSSVCEDFRSPVSAGDYRQ